MPLHVTAYSVKIASPGDAAMEMIIAREVIGQWNASHALAEKRILLPLGDEAPACDLLVDFFCDSPGATGDVSEIEHQLEAGHPALIYFSEGRVNLTGAHNLGSRTLEEFTKKYAAAVVDSYGDEKEFRAKFAQQLDAVVRSHAHFNTGGPSPTQVSRVPAAPAEKPLSICARSILSEACDDFEAYIGHIRIGDSLRIQANGKQLVEQNDPVAAAQWESAFQELLAGGHIRDAGCNGQLFQISTKGFAFLKTIGKTPVGYIAELGGM